jgi:lysine biosynthesis protein LysW
MASTYCPECDVLITIKTPKIGAKFECPECEEELEIVATDPLDVQFAYDDDWDDDDWGDDDQY